MLIKSWSYHKIPQARRVTQSKFHIQDPQTLGAPIQNLVSIGTWCPGFVQGRNIPTSDLLHEICAHLTKTEKTTLTL